MFKTLKIFGLAGQGGSGGSDGANPPPTPPPNFSKPTPASAVVARRPTLKPNRKPKPGTKEASCTSTKHQHHQGQGAEESTSCQRPVKSEPGVPRDGQVEQGGQRGGGEDEEEEEEEPHRNPWDNESEVSSGESNGQGETTNTFVDESFVDSCVAERGPRIISSSNRMFPVRCPQRRRFDGTLPIHPNTHFFDRLACNSHQLGQAQAQLLLRRERRQNVTDDLVIFRRYLEIQTNARDNVFSAVHAARANNPHFNNRISPETERRTRVMCENDLLRIECFIQHLEHRQIDLEQNIRQLEREEAALRFGINYRYQHPSHEFVIYMFEDEHVIQRTNDPVQTGFRFRPTEPPSRPDPEDVPEEPGQPPKKRPRDKRSDTETNRVVAEENTDLESFKFQTVEIFHVHQVWSILKAEKNVLVVFPDQETTLKDLTAQLENNYIIFSDSIRNYYTSGWYDEELHKVTVEFFHLTNRFLSSSVDFLSKKTLVRQLEKVLFEQLDSNLNWYRDTTNAVEKVKLEISKVSSKLYSLKI